MAGAGTTWRHGRPPRRPVTREEHDYTLLVLCSRRELMSVHGLRRALEDMGEAAFESMSYYERWIAAINQNLVEAGVYTLQELGEKMEEIARRDATYGEAQHG